ncbi:MAG: tRNA lysidine(34) synthetase TilS [Cryomorphaceae bacterium]|jgi:tRNA(Ile)-lysidine synthase|nr:tRNA lysidine(34) synthetase TilS [Cryomorphaceae bacterium]
MSDLLSHVQTFLTKYNLRRCFVGCSGGVDSMVLLDIIQKSGLPVKALHVNYNLRREASDADEALIRSYCTQKEIELEVLNLDLQHLLSTEGGNLQQKAREIRRNFFERQIVHPGDGIFLAHHLDDQVETFFLALSRGGGLRSLCCMAEKRERYFRPLLSRAKSELISYATLNSIPWNEDQSNAQLYYSRNRWRTIFLPELKQHFPDLEKNVLVLVEQFQNRLHTIQEEAKRVSSSFLQNDQLDFNFFDSTDSEVLRELLHVNEFSHGTYDELKKIRHSDKGISIQIIHPRYREIFKEDDHFFLAVDKLLKLPKLNTRRVEVLPETFTKQCIYLDPEKVVGSLNLRFWQQGDRIKPIGMKGSKLISDILSDAKIPSNEKSGQLVVHDDEKILWCVGHSVSREALATLDSKKLEVTLDNN